MASTNAQGSNIAVSTTDARLLAVQAAKEQAIKEAEKTYNSMIQQTDQYYDAQIDASKDWAKKQQQLQQENTDFAIEKIEQQKEKTEKDYTKEQSGAYVDWQRQSNEYGAGAETRAASGLLNTGYSESSQVSMYNGYQNRVAVAREVFNLAIQNFDNNIKDAQLHNNSILAEIEFESLQTQLELALECFNYKNDLRRELAAIKTGREDAYYQRYLDVLDQITAEEQAAEEQRRYDAEWAFRQEQADEEKRRYDAEQAWKEAQAAEDKRQYDAEWAWKMEQAAEEQRRYEVEQAWKEAQAAEEKRQFDAQQALKEAQAAEEKRQFDIKNAQEQEKNVKTLTIETPLNLPVKAPPITKSDSKSGGGVSDGGRTHSGGSRSFGEKESTATTHFTTYESAAAYLRASGATKNDGGIMTKTEWARRKAGGSGAEAQYSTYTDYLNAYVDWKRAYPD